MKYYFGIDGGFSKTCFSICDVNGVEIYSSEAFSTNIISVSKMTIELTIKSLFERAMKKLSAKPSDFIAGCYGSSGLDRDNEVEFFYRLFNSILPTVPVYLCSDAEIILVGGLDSLSGICLVSGINSICYGRTTDGIVVKAGGFGWRAGDEGSGWSISQQAISRTLKSKELRDLETDLDKYILDYFNIEKLHDIIDVLNDGNTTKPYIGHFSKYVTEAAEKGDPLANLILEDSGAELYVLVKSVVERLPKNHDKRIVVSGGVIKKDKVVSNKFYSLMRDNLSEYKIISNPIKTPIEGAVLIARTLR
jgi:N-acetylglucosamine kinase-like BadF-type ATPase